MKPITLSCAIAVALAQNPWAYPLAHAQTTEPVEHNAAELDDIVVIGAPLGQTALELAQPVSVLSGDELEEQKRGTLGETVSEMPGVSTSFFGAGVGRPIIRGLDGSRVQTLDNGLSTMDAATSSVDHAVTIEPLLADQIEIFRGPSALIFGGGAIGGAVNVVDNRIPTQVPSAAITGSAEFRAESVSDGTTGVLRLDGGQDQVAWHLDVVRRDNDDYEIPGEAELHHDDDDHDDNHDEGDAEHTGVLENSFHESRSASAGLSYITDRSRIGFSISDSDSLYGLPGGHGHGDEEHEGEDDGDEEETVTLDLEQTRLNAIAELVAPMRGLDLAKLSFSTNDYGHTELEGDEIGTVFENDEYEARVELTHSPLAGFTGVFGVQTRDRDFSAVGEEAFIVPSQTETLGLFLIEEKAFDDWTLQLGIRHDDTDIDAQGGLRADFDALSASAGIVVPFAQHYSFKANVSHAERAPTVEELFSDGLHVATSSFELGNADLSEETSSNLDLSVHRHGDDWSFTISAYLNEFDDFIYQMDTGMDFIDGDEAFPILLWAQEDATLKGVEFETDWHLIKSDLGDLDLRLWGDTVDAELDGGGNLPRIAPARLGGGVHFNASNWRVGLDVIRTFEQDDVAVNEEETDGYTFVNLNASYLIQTERLDIELFARGRNITDEQARNHTSLLKELAPLPGRNWSTGIRLHF